MDDWLSIYVNSLKRIIDENQKFLETEGKILRDTVKNYLETWATIDDIVSRIDRNGSTVMHFAVYHMWFPSGVFSLIYDVLSSDIGGALRALRFSLEAIEIGLIGDCHPNLEFQRKTLEEKIAKLSEMRPINILEALKPIVDDETMRCLTNLYKRFSQLIHPTSFGQKLIELFRETKDVPSIALYYPSLSEVESKIIKNLVELIEQFCKISKKLILIWKDCMSSIR